MSDKYDPENFKFVLWFSGSLHLQNEEMLLAMLEDHEIRKFSSGFIKLNYVIGQSCEIYTKVRGK